MLVFVIMGATDERVPPGFTPIAIGMAVTLILLVGIPVTGASLNPARSTGPATIVGGWALEQLWLFWLAPIVGGVLGGLLYRGLVSGVAADELQLAEAGPALRLTAQNETHRQLVTHRQI
jgi:aquaporin Z